MTACPCGNGSERIPTDVWREKGRIGKEIAVMVDCPACRSTHMIPWNDASEKQRIEAHAAEKSKMAADGWI